MERERDKGMGGGKDRGGIEVGINGGIKGGENLMVGQGEGLKSRTTVPLEAILKQFYIPRRIQSE
jgi:hypothetical protein